MATVPTDAFSWSVTPPSRPKDGFGGVPQTKGVVELEGPSGTERWRVPAAVARRLKKMEKEGRADASSRAELAYLVHEASLEAGKAKVEALVNKRDYSAAELSRKLSRDGYGEKAASELVGWAQRLGLVDDARFASVFIRSKVAAGWGASRIERELARKGVSADDVPGWPEEFLPEEDECARAFELASRRRLTGKNDLQKIVRYLCSRGYSMGLAYDAAKAALDASEE